MKRFRINHHTRYSFPCAVQLLPHTLRLRPKEGHDLRIESSTLEIFPPAVLRWHRDVEENSVAIATFSQSTDVLTIDSETIIQQYNQEPFDFLVADYAVGFPFSYSEEEVIPLTPYMELLPQAESVQIAEWVHTLWQQDQGTETLAVLLDLNQRINRLLTYQVREEEGVQSAEQTLLCRTGSCRDAANLFMVVARMLGFASRFVSGYLHIEQGIAQANQAGSTHAWAEVFIPGAGWKGFDPTVGIIAGAAHIAVAVARLPQSVPPIAGAFLGAANATMEVDVRVTEIID